MGGLILHMCFTGPPGTGKTTMALRMASTGPGCGMLTGLLPTQGAGGLAMT